MSNHQGSSIAQLRAKLISAPHGGAACDAINELCSAAIADQRQVRQLLAEYATRGAISHMRTYAASRLAKLISAPDAAMASLFERLLGDPVTRYWAITGLIHSRGPAAYPVVAALAMDRDLPLQERANAVKQLALASGQLFDRQLPSDPGRWAESDLRLNEVRDWAVAGFQRGSGYPPPSRHPALDHPTTDFEHLVARLDQCLAEDRDDEDPANPRNRLIPASADQMAAIVGRWELPGLYQGFLARFSPVRVTIPGDRFFDGGLALYGAAELIDRQLGYARLPDGQPVPGWPTDFVVIADHGGDPFVLNLGHISEGDAPVQ